MAIMAVTKHRPMEIQNMIQMQNVARTAVCFLHYLTGRMDKETLLKQRIISEKMAKQMPEGTDINKDQIRKLIVESREDKDTITVISSDLIEELSTIEQMINEAEELTELLSNI